MMMNLHATQDKTLENYFDALLFAENSSLFADAEAVLPQRRVAPESVNDFQPLPLAYQTGLYVEAQSVAEQLPPLGNDDTPVVSLSTDVIVDNSKRAEQFLLVRPVTVVGLKLAVSMESVTEVLPIETQELHKVTNQSGVYATLHYRLRDIPVLDTAAIVIPLNHPRRAAMLARKSYQHILVLDDGRFAMVVDVVDEEVYLPIDSMRWSDSVTQHNWLAGTWVDYGYALVDTGKLLNCL